MKNIMTPLKIEILLWYYHNGADFKNLDAPAVKEAMDEFVELGLLVESDVINRRYEAVDEALEVYVRELLAVPLPTKEWVCKREKT